MDLEDMNSKMRINFDQTIMNIESKVGNERQKAFECIVNDYKSEISKKNELLIDVEKEWKVTQESLW